jgi:glucose-6-phosphate isomerase
MALAQINPTITEAWAKLTQHHAQIKNTSLKEIFANDSQRAEKFHIKWQDFLVDYSKNILNQETINLLLDLAKEVQLQEAISQYFDGDAINQTENRAVLHTALRAPENQLVLVD